MAEQTEEHGTRYGNYDNQTKWLLQMSYGQYICLRFVYQISIEQYCYNNKVRINCEWIGSDSGIKKNSDCNIIFSISLWAHFEAISWSSFFHFSIRQYNWSRTIRICSDWRLPNRLKFRKVLQMRTCISNSIMTFWVAGNGAIQMHCYYKEITRCQIGLNQYFIFGKVNSFHPLSKSTGDWMSE